MRPTPLVLALILAVAGCRGRSSSMAPATVDAPAILQEADRLAGLDLWPGFDARAVPVALFDGERTWLRGHPSPPAGYQPDGRTGLLVRAGRDTLVWANSSVMMNGVRTATVMPGSATATLAERASVVIHERFHVFQIARHPHWEANEVDLFTYPVADGALLSLRRQESVALRRALAAGDHDETKCWARTALEARQQRFSRLPPAASNYERRSEWREGLANYVQARSLGFPGNELPPGEFRPDEVRQRTYATGVVLGRLLDRLDPSWRETLERRDSVPLDSALALVVGWTSSRYCVLPEAERTEIDRVAAGDAAALRAGLAAAREAFLARPGLTVVITAGAEPLWPQGFDPLNVRVITQQEVLHTRFVRLGNRSGSVEVLGDSALTVAAGEHPMFNGLRSITLTGLPGDLPVTAAGDSVIISHPKVRASFRGAAVERSAGRLAITLR